MKEKYIPLEKQSRKRQKEWYAKRRGSWNEISPVERKVGSKKAFRKSDRQKARNELRQYCL